MVVSFLIGAVVGGVVMGVLDANRPEPLFSSASPAECSYLMANHNQLVAQMNLRPILLATWNEMNQTRTEIRDNFDECRSNLCQPIQLAIRENGLLQEEWGEARDRANAQIGPLLAPYVQPYPPKIVQQYDALMEEIQEAATQHDHYEELVEQRQQEFDEAGCDDNPEAEYAELDAPPGDTTSGGDLEVGSY